jgi:hypothetical protein
MPGSPTTLPEGSSETIRLPSYMTIFPRPSWAASVADARWPPISAGTTRAFAPQSKANSPQTKKLFGALADIFPVIFSNRQRG